MNRLTRSLLLLTASALGSACQPTPSTPAAVKGDPLPLALMAVERQPALRERVWDGVVEAVNQATLSAQTGGRVVALPFDVNDFVKAGEVVVRFTDVEQQSAQRQASAALEAAEAGYQEPASWCRGRSLTKSLRGAAPLRRSSTLLGRR